MSAHQEYYCETCDLHWEALENKGCPRCRELAPATGSAATEPGPNQYRCAWCNGIFDLQRNEDWNEEKAHAERERDFPGVPKEQCAVVCDDCYQKCRPDTHLKEYEAYKAEKN